MTYYVGHTKKENPLRHEYNSTMYTNHEEWTLQWMRIVRAKSLSQKQTMHGTISSTMRGIDR